MGASSASSAVTASEPRRSSRRGEEVAVNRITKLDPARRRALLQTKLGALVSGHWGEGAAGGAAVAGSFPGGATLRTQAQGWVLAEDRPERALGGALAWSRRHGLSEVHVLAEKATGTLARRAGAFAHPPHVWQVAGRALTPAEPEAVTTEPALPPEVEAFVPFFLEAGVEPVAEHGVLAGEVLGLEVARVVVDELGAFLEVGVGKHDRYAQRLMHHDRPPLETLAAAAAAVREVRRPDVASHQINQLSRERWLRSVVVADPTLVGASSLSPVPSPVPRTDLRLSAPAPAAGLDAAGRPVLVVCSTGIDLDLVPTAADVRLRDGRQAGLVLALPTADDHPVTRELAGALIEPARVATIPGDWRRRPAGPAG